MKGKIHFWDSWDWYDLKRGFLIIDIIFISVFSLLFYPKIMHRIHGKGMTATTRAYIKNIQTKGGISEDLDGNHEVVDAYIVDYTYYVDSVVYQGEDLIPNATGFQSLKGKLLYSREDIFVQYDPSSPNRSQLKLDK